MASATPKENKEKTPKAKTTAPEASLNMDELRELADLVDERGFTDFEFENEKIRVRLSKNVMGRAASANTAPQSADNASVAATDPESAEQVASEADAGLHKITSPIVGTFYRAPSPEKQPYVKEGDSVTAESVVCIVEAMKLMNEIQAEVSGEIVKVYVENAQPVEFGQPLFGIKM